jgi:uncharacterized protein (DUF1697 family)
MKEQKYLALLRGINVGGNNIIRMTDLKACFEKMGFANVSTYIQSGNVLFTSKQLISEQQIEKVLSKQFDYKSRVVVVTYDQLKDVVQHAPEKFGKEPEKYRYDIIFLKKPHTGGEAILDIPVNKSVDAVYAGKHVVYFLRLIAKATQSHLPKVIQLPIYQNMTIRNWNTTTKLLGRMNSTL